MRAFAWGYAFAGALKQVIVRGGTGFHFFYFVSGRIPINEPACRSRPGAPLRGAREPSESRNVAGLLSVGYGGDVWLF